MYDSDASLLEVKRLTLQLQETLPFEIYSKFPVVLTGKLLDSWMMLDAHSEALQNSTCCRPWVPGWCHPSVHQSLQSQRYLASIAWCQMILAHVLDFLCTDWKQFSFMLSIVQPRFISGTEARLFEQFVEDQVT